MAASEDTQQLTVGRPNREIIYFKPTKPGALTIRNHNFSAGSYHRPHRQATRNEG
ncbi:MAG: hypothetical protein QOH49_3927 [Acidobacteriota bacterium]|jgi:hypothetical protein|nr:hypothetical protein [Acidobacteriota bacterium]